MSGMCKINTSQHKQVTPHLAFSEVRRRLPALSQQPRRGRQAAPQEVERPNLIEPTTTHRRGAQLKSRIREWENNQRIPYKNK